MPKKFFAIASHGLLKKGSKYLVTKRAMKNDYMPGYWDIPGGTINFGENTLVALKREFLEETKLRIIPGKIMLAYGYASRKYRHQFQLVFECKYKSGTIKLNPKEHSEYRWVTLSELGKLRKIAFLNALYKELK